MRFLSHMLPAVLMLGACNETVTVTEVSRTSSDGTKVYVNGNGASPSIYDTSENVRLKSASTLVKICSGSNPDIYLTPNGEYRTFQFDLLGSVSRKVVGPEACQ